MEVFIKAEQAQDTKDLFITLKGGTPLNGEISLSGAKNAFPKAMVASLLTSETCTLTNVPEIEDVAIMTTMIESVGGTVIKEGDSLKLTTPKLLKLPPKEFTEMCGKSRIPVLLAGPFLHRCGEVYLPNLGGCAIGKRPVDFHLSALQSLGATYHGSSETKGYHLTAEKLTGGKIHLDYPSVGATEQALLTSVLAEGTTELTNAAVEPEIIDLILVLIQMGAVIYVKDNRTIIIHGVKSLSGYNYRIIPDRNEAASWACAAAATNGRIFVKNAKQLDLLTFLSTFTEIGGKFIVHENGIEFFRGENLRPTFIETEPHPGFMTDWQQPLVVVLTQADGASIIHETVHENRFGFAATLNRMGAHIQVFKDCLGGGQMCRFGQRNFYHSAVVMGPTPLIGANIKVPDLRAGMSLLIAACASQGESTITGVQTLQRGYPHLLQKLTDLKVNILSTNLE